VTEFPEDILIHTSVLNTSSPTEVLPCYNNFLLFHNLPLLTNSPTLQFFLNYLQTLSFYSNIKISINSEHTETHIYIHIKDPLLPHHTLIQQSEYYKFRNLPIKSLSQSNSSQNSPTIELLSKSIKIASLNINGLISPHKKINLIDSLYKYQIDILGISETHLSTREANFILSNTPEYISYWSSYSKPHQAGVGIIIKAELSKYIARTHNYNGHIIGIDLHFKQNPIRLLQIYLPTQEKKKLRKEIQETIINLLTDNNYKTIIMGDFNSVPNPRKDRNPPKSSSIPESQLLKFLISHQFMDSYVPSFL
jgi:hypothetical protein